MARGLTKLQLEFAREYAVDLNGTAALIRARATLGLKGSRKTAAKDASKLVSQGKVRAAVREFEKSNFAELAASTGVSSKNVLQRVLEIAEADIGEAFDDDGNLRPISEIPVRLRRAISMIESFEEYQGQGEKREAIGMTRRIRLIDKNPALTNLMKHLKLLTEQVEFPSGVPFIFETGESGTPGSMAPVVVEKVGAGSD